MLHRYNGGCLLSDYYVPNMVIVNIKAQLLNQNFLGLNPFQPICNYMLLAFPILGSCEICELK